MRVSVLALGCCLLALAAAAVHADPGHQEGPEKGKGCVANVTTCAFGSEARLVNNGTRRSANWVTVCQPCRPGSYTPAAGSCCQECRGIISVTGETATCTPCPGEGSRPVTDPATNQTTCVCMPGYQSTGSAPVTGVAGCAPCQPGFASANATTSTAACVACADGFAAPRNASRECLQCSNNSTALPDHTACVCPAGYYVKTPVKQVRGKMGGRPGFGGHKEFDHDKYGRDQTKIACLQCDGAVSNPAGNVWPACCATGTAWNGTACV